MEQLGIDPKLLISQIVNFVIILFILQKLLYKPILDMLNKRKKEIAEGVSLTEKMRLEEEKFKEKQEHAMAKAREEAVVIIEEAKKEAKDVEKELIADAHKEAEAIIERAKADAVEVVKNEEVRLRKEAVELSVALSKRLLSSVMSAKEQHAFIAKRMKDLEAWAKGMSV